MRELFPERLPAERDYREGQAHNFVPPVLVEGGTRLVVGEAPGATEAETGIPFTGGAGGWFDGFLRNANIPRSTLSIVNTLCCRPPENFYPTSLDARKYFTKEEGQQVVAHCWKAHVLPVLHNRDWKRVDLLGDKALQACAGKTGITNWRGSAVVVPEVHPSDLRGMPTIHPAAIARSQNLLPAVISDLKKSLAVPPENYVTNPSLQQVREFRATRFAFDIETRFDIVTRAWTKGITMVGLSSEKYHAILVPFTGLYVEELKRIFRDATEVIGQNCLQFDIPVLEENGVSLAPLAKVWDIMLMQHLLQPDMPHDLEFIASIFTNKPIWKYLKGQSEEVYCSRDVDATYQAWLQLAPLVKMHGLEDLYWNTQVPLARICKIMKDTGMRVDTGNLSKVRAELQAKIVKLNELLPPLLQSREVIYNKREPAPVGHVSEKTGKPLKFINVPTTEILYPWRSGEIAMEWLYGEQHCCLPVELSYETDKPTADRLALEKLSNKLKKHTIHVRSELKPKTCPEQVALDLWAAAVIDALREMRKADKLIGTYTVDEKERVERINPSFNVHGTSSGRLSSSGPNFQNIPESMRYCYVPDDPNWCFVEADYSQGENRITAFLAGDIERLNRLNDPSFSEHKYAASIFFGVPIEQVVKSSDKDSYYAKAKPIVHGMNYGEGAKKIARDNELNLAEVLRWQGEWKAAIRKTTEWQQDTAKRAVKHGFLTTPFSRKRWFYSSSRYTESLSFLPQSILADISFRVMISLMHERIGLTASDLIGKIGIIAPLALPAKLHLQVHDSLLISCPEAMAPEVVALLHKVMEQPWSELENFVIPIEVKVGAPGASWGECVRYGN